mmetsp:Transcript_45071/g.114276  ORF Transcript_45071/g.114276 Transcript_45071/m.114276 type:complete len:216 (-) Transcript_45071:1188-1835(-)
MDIGLAGLATCRDSQLMGVSSRIFNGQVWTATEARSRRSVEVRCLGVRTGFQVDGHHRSMGQRWSFAGLDFVPFLGCSSVATQSAKRSQPQLASPGLERSPSLGFACTASPFLYIRGLRRSHPSAGQLDSECLECSSILGAAGTASPFLSSRGRRRSPPSPGQLEGPHFWGSRHKAHVVLAGRFVALDLRWRLRGLVAPIVRPVGCSRKRRRRLG